jgi:hypothetical protein
MDTFTAVAAGPAAARACGRRLSVYVDPPALELLAPWGADRLRSARLNAVLGRYDALASGRRPELGLHEWNIILHLLQPLSSWRDGQLLWAAIDDRRREKLSLPGVDPEQLVSRLRALTAPEIAAMLEVVDRASLIEGSVHQRLLAAGLEVA